MMLLLAVCPGAAPGCMSKLEGRRLKATVVELRERLDARGDTDREVEKEIATLTRAFQDVQARWVSGGGSTNLAVTRMEGEVAALEAGTNQLAQEIQRQARIHADVSDRFEKRLLALEQSDAQLADKVGLFIPDDKDELWRQAVALLASGQRSQGRRYCHAFTDRFPQDPRASQAYLAIGRSYADEAHYSNAAAVYQRLLSMYPTAPEAPEAMWQLSRTFGELSFCSDARALLRDLVDRYPKSPEATEAMKQLRGPKRRSNGADCVS